MGEKLQDLLFDTPYWLFGLLALLGVALLVSGNRRQDKRLLRAGAGLFALWAVFAGLNYFIDTDKEKCIKRTRGALSAVEQKDFDTFAALLHPQVELGAWEGKKDLVEGAKKYTDMFKLKDIKVTSVAAAVEDVRIHVTFSAVTHHEPGEVPMESIPSTWRFEWLPGGDGWLLHELKPLKIGTQDVSQLTPYIDRKP